ncbi:polysaccharide pyruvyl transferase family protein [Neorhodopirellula lusitana]|uniref:polysaccharide pyruvyl transferase family protein n=1 Tax=Neorhodopirellula lusitana TaxID=445327 RepID=UPI00384F0EAA
MKLGIITYHDINNYGAQLQASSLQQFLDQSEHDCELVDYRPLRHDLRRCMTWIRAASKLHIEDARNEAARTRMFQTAIREMASLSERSTHLASGVAGICKVYDALICGSDELWNFGNYLGYQAPYILDFEVRSHVQKLSYAASVGSYTPTSEIANKMKVSLENFSSILVRDERTRDFCNSCSLEADIVLDPTFLTDLNPIQPAISGYAMLSGAMSTMQVDKCVEAANSLGLRPVSPGVTYPRHRNIGVAATPQEWIGYIKNADCHMTSLFHGTAYSLNFGTPFCVFHTHGKESKISSLLSRFKAKERLVESGALPELISATASSPFPSEMPGLRGRLILESQEKLLNALDA